MSRDAVAVRAAGAVLYRVRRGRAEVAVVHRPRYGDWSLPKGKVKDGERLVGTAVRELAEETGSTALLSRRLGVVAYRVPAGRKEVTYWLARHESGDFSAGHEVDELRWLAPAVARERVRYRGDRRMIDAAFARPLPEAVVVLVRHARAGKRSAWQGPDARRPLSRSGRRQADALAAFLPAFGPRRVVSAEPLRCVQTVEPFADRAGLAVRIDDRLGDHRFAKAPKDGLAALRSLARHSGASVVCSQGEAIPGLLARLWPHRAADTKKGHAWVLSFAGGDLICADHYPDAGRA